MAYAPGTQIPYFSNPDVSYMGVPTGVADGQADSADNAISRATSAPAIPERKATWCRGVA